MALTPPTTLGKARLSVAIRCGQAQGNSVPENLTPLIDEKLRSAQKRLWLEAWWTRNLVRQSFPLTAGISDYDFPDNLSSEGVVNLAVLRASDSRVYDIQPGIRTDERNSAAISNNCPLRYTFEDQLIRLFPAPDALWSQLIIDGYLQPGAFTDPAENAVVDEEALITLGEILIKGHFGLPTVEEKSNFDRYLSQLRSRQSDGEGFQLGGPQSYRTQTVPRNRIVGSRSLWNVSGPNWRPW